MQICGENMRTNLRMMHYKYGMGKGQLSREQRALVRIDGSATGGGNRGCATVATMS